MKYDNKDCYIASSYLTLKDPAAKKETKATKTETKATETKATESKTETKTEATESKTETNTVTEEPQTDTDTQTVTEETESQTQETESQTEATEPQTEETEPPTVTAKGVVTDVGSNSLTLDNGTTYNLKGAKVDGSLSADNAIGQEVVVEYYENSKDAVSVYPVGGSKALDSESGTSGATTIAIILALIAIAIAAIIVFLRNRRKNAA